LALDLQDSTTGTRGRDDLLLQKITGDLVAYRLVESNPPIARDFQSHYERGDRPNPTQHYKAFDWLGVSMFTQRNRVESFVQRARASGRPAWLAEVRLVRGHGMYVIYNSKTTHLEVFGFPQVLLGLVDHIDD